MRSLTLLLCSLIVPVFCHRQNAILVGPEEDGSHVVATRQVIRPAGESLEFGGRPVDLVLSGDGKTLYVKGNRGWVLVDRFAWQIGQELPFGEKTGGSMHGIAVTRDGSHVYATTARDLLWEAATAQDDTLSWSRKILLPGPGGTGNSHACGIALSPGEERAYVCLSCNNSLGIVDLQSGALTGEIHVGVAPFDVVLSADGGKAYVSNWGGRHGRERMVSPLTRGRFCSGCGLAFDCIS